MSDSHSDSLLHTLLDIAQQMNETRAVIPLLRYAVDVSIEIINASHGYVILADSHGHLEFPVARDADGNTVENPENEISRKILYRVLDEKTYIRTASAVTDNAYNDSVSVRALQIKSVLCVPLIASGDVLGAIYIENRDVPDVFEEAQVKPLLYLAGHTALCVKNTILEQDLEALRSNRVQTLSDSDDLAKAAHEAVQREMKEQRDRMLHGFIRDTSHHFRTPLTVIRTSVDLLRRKVDQTIAGDYLQRINHQVDAIVGLVDALNLLLKMDAGLDNVFMQQDPGLLIVDEHENASRHAHRAQVRIKKILPETPIMIDVIQELARHAIRKVLTNAIDYSPPDSVVTIEVVETPDAGHIIIRDEGPGIPAAEIDNVRRRFYQLDKSGTKRGLGVGLAIADSAMAAHNGEMRIESEAGTGTTVTLVFPKRNKGE